MLPRTLRPIFPALLLLAAACGTKSVGGGFSTSSSSTSTAAGTGGSAASAGAGGHVAAVGSTSSSATGAGATGGGGGASGTCTLPQEVARWAAAIEAPVTLGPARAGNLNLAGPSGMGLTLLEAEQINCPCAPVTPNPFGTMGGSGSGGAGGGGTGGTTGTGGAGGSAGPNDYCQWGDNGEIGADYLASTQVIQFINLWPGYTGALGFESRDGMHTYSIPIITGPITKDGQPFLLNWTTAAFNEDPTFNSQINELYDGIAATYAPSLPAETDCQGTKDCVVGGFGTVAFMYFPKVGLATWIASLDGGQPEASTMNRIDLYPMTT